MAKTLCEWTKKDIEAEAKRLAALIAHPRYYCRKCARAAADDKVLCKAKMLGSLRKE